MNTLISVFLLSAAVVSASPALKLDLSGPPSSVGIDGLMITSTLKNTGDEPIKLLNSPNSVLSSDKTEVFSISSTSGSPAFTGIRVKYSPVLNAALNLKDAFTVLAPGQSVEKVHSLAGAYNFTQSGEGAYDVSAVDLFYYVDKSGALQTVQATSSSGQFQVTGRLAAPNGAIPRLSRRAISYIGCADEQKKMIEIAAGDANGYVDKAKTYLNNNPSGGPQYEEWFGVMNDARYETVVSHFTKIAEDPATSKTYDCSTCTMANTYAYVYPDEPGTIYLCPAFWPAPATGVDSKAGTIVHENSHFDWNGGTRDYAYGQPSCRVLATGTPDVAVQNADNHEYFVETM
ncbi:hypothetical protein FRC12_019677 [Ceratobasidium sp. 428]|nr:hypothetical protein FRC12_019677 [Ceratobasidium sp. 428]